MKKLIFVRHGKAEAPTSEIQDFERSLTMKGKIISRLMAHKLLERDKSPGKIITSPAFRAIETAFIFATEFGIDYDSTSIRSRLYYNTDFSSLLEILSHINEDEDVISLFGHNPSFTELANTLCKEGCDFIPKSGVVGISFKVRTWSEIRHNAGKMDYFLKPEKIL